MPELSDRGEKMISPFSNPLGSKVQCHKIVTSQAKLLSRHISLLPGRRMEQVGIDGIG
jgi:hypothetical protein